MFIFHQIVKKTIKIKSHYPVMKEMNIGAFCRTEMYFSNFLTSPVCVKTSNTTINVLCHWEGGVSMW
jgi:hypothetical protein